MTIIAPAEENHHGTGEGPEIAMGKGTTAAGAESEITVTGETLIAIATGGGVMFPLTPGEVVGEETAGSAGLLVVPRKRLRCGKIYASILRRSLLMARCAYRHPSQPPPSDQARKKRRPRGSPS
jgi:hypothetical protein